MSLRYTSGRYAEQNRGWHVADSPWKATQVLAALNGWQPATICEVGCGGGEILRQLHDKLPAARLVGYEIAPVAIELAQHRATDRLSFRLQEAETDADTFELMLIMDVVEHVQDPLDFCRRCGSRRSARSFTSRSTYRSRASSGRRS